MFVKTSMVREEHRAVDGDEHELLESRLLVVLLECAVGLSLTRV
jgi:hypothetical protein